MSFVLFLFWCRCFFSVYCKIILLSALVGALGVVFLCRRLLFFRLSRSLSLSLSLCCSDAALSLRPSGSVRLWRSLSFISCWILSYLLLFHVLFISFCVPANVPNRCAGDALVSRFYRSTIFRVWVCLSIFEAGNRFYKLESPYSFFFSLSLSRFLQPSSSLLSFVVFPAMCIWAKWLHFSSIYLTLVRGTISSFALLRLFDSPLFLLLFVGGARFQ